MLAAWLSVLPSIDCYQGLLEAYCQGLSTWKRSRLLTKNENGNPRALETR